MTSNRFLDFLIERDMFGQPVSINYEGSDMFRTKLGALLSILTYTLMIFNLVSLTNSFNDGSKQEQTTNTVVIDRFESGSFNLQENQFDITLILLNNLPANIGRIVAK